MTVLVADDQPIDRMILVDTLKLLGVDDIETADNGAEVLSRIADHGERIDTLLLDLMMPGTDGVEILSELENQRFQGRVGFISSADNEQLKAAVLLATGYGLNVLGNLAKPVTR